MNERGYTLIELLAVIVVLALLSTVAFVSISKVMGTAKERYYISLENNLEAVARDFASDNRNYLPKSIGGIKKIYLGTLKKANYIKDVIDYNKSDCFDDQTYVQVFKYAKGKYSYTTFLVCPTYSTSKDSNSIVYPVISELYFDNDVNPSNFNFKIEGGSVKLLSYTVRIYLDNRLDSSNTYMLDSKDSYSSNFSLSKYRGNTDNLRVELTVVNINGLATTKTLGKGLGYKVNYYVDGSKVSTIPLKTSGYVIDTNKGSGTGIECNNLATASWDNDNWNINVSNITLSGTYCNVYFKTPIVHVGKVGYDCSNNEVWPTVPNTLNGLAKIMAEQSSLDNSKSEFVSNCSGIKFNAISSDTNGKGVYEIASTKNDTYPIYYYRGAVTNNNVLFANFCWKIVRTTNTGGVKLVYNGTPNNGQCTNTTGEATQIGKSLFNASEFNSSMSPAYVGYMYGTIDHSSAGSPYTYSYKHVNASSNYIYGNGVTYNSTTGIYTLTDTLNMTSSNYNKGSSFSNYHYTCFTTSNTCTTLYYVYYIVDSTTQYYITITGVDPGTKELIYVVIEDMLLNDKDSRIKTNIDNWYSTNMTGYTNKLEDTVFCNDRSIDTTNEAHGLGGWNPDGGLMDKWLYYSEYNRVNNYTPTLTCSRDIDKFTVSNSIGNGKLTYPVGLLTVDEVMYAGGKNLTRNNTYYLYTNQNWWLSSPDTIINNYVATEYYLGHNGGIVGNTNDVGYGLRPSVSLASTSIITQGDGTATNPYIIA